MINLIPNQEKKKKVKDFYFRLTVVFFTILGFSFLIGSIAILPSYFLSYVKKNLNDTKLEIQKQESVPPVDQENLTIVQDLDSKLNVVENADKNGHVVSREVISEIVLQKMSDISITQITYENTSPGNQKISIRGTAPNRERLLLFRQALEDNTAFEKVDLPISNFVKESNIEFYLSLIPS